MVSDDLRRQADHFLDLDILADYIDRVNTGGDGRDAAEDDDEYYEEEMVG